jgi:hypothetical protein
MLYFSHYLFNVWSSCNWDSIGCGYEHIKDAFCILVIGLNLTYFVSFVSKLKFCENLYCVDVIRIIEFLVFFYS